MGVHPCHSSCPGISFHCLSSFLPLTHQTDYRQLGKCYSRWSLHEQHTYPEQSGSWCSMHFLILLPVLYMPTSRCTIAALVIVLYTKCVLMPCVTAMLWFLPSFIMPHMLVLLPISSPNLPPLDINGPNTERDNECGLGVFKGEREPDRGQSLSSCVCVLLNATNQPCHRSHKLVMVGGVLHSPLIKGMKLTRWVRKGLCRTWSSRKGGGNTSKIWKSLPRHSTKLAGVVWSAGSVHMGLHPTVFVCIEDITTRALPTSWVPLVASGVLCASLGKYNKCSICAPVNT